MRGCSRAWSSGCATCSTFPAAPPTSWPKRFGTASTTISRSARSAGAKPEKPYSGNFVVRVKSSLHRKAAIRAAAEGISLNAWIAKQIEGAERLAYGSPALS